MTEGALSVLIPTKDRPSALAVTLAGLAGQTATGFRIVISDQSEGPPACESAEVATLLRVLRLHGHEVDYRIHLPRRGMAEQRAFLLSQARSELALFLDDDLLLGRSVVRRLCSAIRREGCGFVGCAPIGLSYTEDVRPHEQQLELWDGPVAPERVAPGEPEWERHALHNAANLLHVQPGAGELGEDEYVAYKVAWIGGCVMYRTSALRAVGGFDFWHELPDEHAGEDVVAQIRVMERFGGCGIMPSEVYHLELPTTIPRRPVDAPHVLLR
ncbi:MAG: glycosyltransferase [Coriobacteriia bacterium]